MNSSRLGSGSVSAQATGPTTKAAAGTRGLCAEADAQAVSGPVSGPQAWCQRPTSAAPAGMTEVEQLTDMRKRRGSACLTSPKHGRSAAFSRCSDKARCVQQTSCCLATDDDGSVACCFSKASYVAGVAGEDAVAGRGEEYYGRVDRV